jgi:hypothetical protein
MRRILVLAVVGGLLPATAQDFKIYPGAVRDQPAARAASLEKARSEVYTSNDTFVQIYAFYKAIYREAPHAPPPPKLPSGKPVRWAFFILDDAETLARSKHWLKIQTPYISTVGEDLDFQGIRDVCVIQSIRR